MIIKTQAHPRCGLVGNPSDGYYGKTISFTFKNFAAEVVLYQTPELEIIPSRRDHSRFGSIDYLVRDVGLFGYYGGIRLLKATIKRFHDYCRENGLELDERNFTIRYHSNIPDHVGLAGSSAIITSCLRALMAFYGISIPDPVQANLILSVETDELGIPAGLQDRVAQVYEGLVFMDFGEKLMKTQGYGRYERMDPALLPPVYVAYMRELGEGTEVFHNDIRGRFNRGEPEVVEAMRFWAGLADEVRTCLLDGRQGEVGDLLNANFDRRRVLYQLSEGNLKMVDAARSTGASAKFCGSGGAIVGTYEDDAMFERLRATLEPIGIHVLKPELMEPGLAE